MRYGYRRIIGLLVIALPAVTHAEHIVTSITTSGWEFNYFTQTYVTTVFVTSQKISGLSDQITGLIPGGIQYGLWMNNPNGASANHWTMANQGTTSPTNHYPVTLNSSPPITTNTWASLESLWFSQNSGTIQWLASSTTGNDLCVAPGYAPTSASPGISQATPPIMYPGKSYCYPIPGPDSASCTIAGETELDFGTVNSGNVSIERNKSLTLSCDKASSVMFADPTGQGGQRSLAGGTVTLRVNSGMLPVLVMATSGNNPISISGTLAGTVTTGSYSNVIPISVTFQ